MHLLVRAPSPPWTLQDSPVPASVEADLKHSKKRKAALAATAAVSAATDAVRENQNKTFVSHVNIFPNYTHAPIVHVAKSAL